MPWKVIYEVSLITSVNKIIMIMIKCTDSLYAPVFSIQLASLQLFYEVGVIIILNLCLG